MRPSGKPCSQPLEPRPGVDDLLRLEIAEAKDAEGHRGTSDLKTIEPNFENP
jgi:hypothetical protein